MKRLEFSILIIIFLPFVVHAQAEHPMPEIGLKLISRVNQGNSYISFPTDIGFDALSMKRLNLSLTFYYHPKFLEDIGLFVQYYHGSDYYNMCFNHRLDMFRFGLMTEKLRF